VEYAIEAIKLGSTAIGICTSEGVVLAVEKRITSPLMEPTTIEKIVEVDKHIGKSIFVSCRLFNNSFSVKTM
jgi:20S proteasome subunit alpha 5